MRRLLQICRTRARLLETASFEERLIPFLSRMTTADAISTLLDKPVRENQHLWRVWRLKTSKTAKAGVLLIRTAISENRIWDAYLRIVKELSYSSTMRSCKSQQASTGSNTTTPNQNQRRSSLTKLTAYSTSSSSPKQWAPCSSNICATRFCFLCKTRIAKAESPLLLLRCRAYSPMTNAGLKNSAVSQLRLCWIFGKKRR